MKRITNGDYILFCVTVVTLSIFICALKYLTS